MAAHATQGRSRRKAGEVAPRRAAGSRPRIAIVGAGFAGLAAAQNLGREYAVTVIDRSGWFEWLPNIHELLSGVKRPADLRLPLSRLVARAGHRFVQAEATGIDARAGHVLLVGGRRISFDSCIVAIGGAHDTFGVRGADRYAMSFKGVDDCHAIGRALAALARSRKESSVVIVGGGLEGIEALGEILRRYGHIGTLRVTIVEAGPRLLPASPPALDARVRAHCAKRNVRILANSAVTSVTRTRVNLRSGESLRSDLTIWTGGVTAPPLLHAAGLAPQPGAWATVNRALRSTKFDNVFVVGDAASPPRELAKQAFYAMQMGECAAGNAARVLADREPRAFKPSPKPVLVAFGDLDTFLVAGRSVVASPALAAAKEAVFQLTMAKFDPPLRVAPLRRLARRLAHASRKLPLGGLA